MQRPMIVFPRPKLSVDWGTVGVLTHVMFHPFPLVFRLCDQQSLALGPLLFLAQELYVTSPVV